MNTCVRVLLLLLLQARRSSQSEAVALQAIRNAKGNHLCVDCEAPSEHGRVQAPHKTSSTTSACGNSEVTTLSPCCRSHLGQPQPGRAHLHRVLRDPSQPGDPPVPRALAGPGRLAGGAHAGPGGHREPHGQQPVGELHPRANQTHADRHPVGVHSNADVQMNNAAGSFQATLTQCVNLFVNSGVIDDSVHMDH